MRLKLFALAATVAVATPIIAKQAMQAPGSKNDAAITGGTYTADPNHTLVSWKVDHLGFTPYYGLFGEITGTLQFDPKAPNAAKVDVTIPVSKVTTASAALTAHLLKAGKDGGKPDFFGAAPADARFVSTRVVATGKNAVITGDLTLNGVTRPVTLKAKFYGAGTAPAQMGGKQNIGFEASGSIKRSDFGISMFIPMVGDTVHLKIAAGFQK